MGYMEVYKGTEEAYGLGCDVQAQVYEALMDFGSRLGPQAIMLNEVGNL